MTPNRAVYFNGAIHPLPNAYDGTARTAYELMNESQNHNYSEMIMMEVSDFTWKPRENNKALIDLSMLKAQISFDNYALLLERDDHVSIPTYVVIDMYHIPE